MKENPRCITYTNHLKNRIRNLLIRYAFWCLLPSTNLILKQLEHNLNESLKQYVLFIMVEQFAYDQKKTLAQFKLAVF